MQGWRALVVVPAFGLDTFAVAVGLGAATSGQRRTAAVVVACFEGGMPLLGALAGARLGLLSGYAVWAAAGLVALLGVRELVEGWAELHAGERPSGGAPPRRRLGPWGLLAMGLAVSLDELAAGMAAGTARLPLGLLVPALAAQAVVCTYAGLRAGSGLRHLVRRYGELAGGLALLAVAVAVVLLGPARP